MATKGEQLLMGNKLIWDSKLASHVNVSEWSEHLLHIELLIVNNITFLMLEPEDEMVAINHINGKET